MALLTIVSGWTEALGPFTLRADGVAVDLTAFTVEAVIRNSLGTLVAAAGDVTVRDQVAHPGQVMYAPVATDFVHQSTGSKGVQAFRLHWRVTDGSGKIVFFPNGEAEVIDVYPT